MRSRRRVVRAIRRALHGTRWYEGDSWFYNLDNYRRPRQVARELRAIATRRPETIDLVECTGNVLPDLPGYDLIRSMANDGRRGIAAYVRSDLPHTNGQWVDHKQTWRRTQQPGVHPARATLVYRLGRMQRLVAHQAPKFTSNTRAAQLEGVVLIGTVMSPWRRRGWPARPTLHQAREWLRPRMLMWDANRRAGESGPGPTMLAKRVRGRVVGGSWIDSAVVRRVRVRSVDSIRVVDGVRLESDHGHAIRIRWRVRRVWIR